MSWLLFLPLVLMAVFVAITVIYKLLGILFSSESETDLDSVIFGTVEKDAIEELLLSPQSQLFSLMPHKQGKIPTKSNPADAGFDLYSIEETIIQPGELKVIPLGICIDLPPGYVAKVFDRSSMASKGLLTLGGVIDSGYKGELKVILKNLSDKPYSINIHDRIAQLLLLPLADENMTQFRTNSSSSRNSGGFGSSGR